jgi:transcriptional regulator with XRE-family HTH domain
VKKVKNANEDGDILNRLIAFAQQKVGESYGWKGRFASLLGISNQYLSNILVGRQSIGPAILERLRKLGCDIDWLLTGEIGDDPASRLRNRINELEARIIELEHQLRQKDEILARIIRDAEREIERLKFSASDTARSLLKVAENQVKYRPSKKHKQHKGGSHE